MTRNVDRSRDDGGHFSDMDAGDGLSCSGIAPVEIRTERLLLRPFQPADVDDALAYRHDEEFALFLPHIPQPFTREHAEAFVALNMSEPWHRSPVFAVVLNGKLIGTVNLEVDHETRSAMLGYAIARTCWGQGVATEAARAVVAWGIETFQLTRIWASTDSRHVRSIRVMEKLGLQREGVRIADRIGRDGKPTDSVVCGLNLIR